MLVDRMLGTSRQLKHLCDNFPQTAYMGLFIYRERDGRGEKKGGKGKLNFKDLFIIFLNEKKKKKIEVGTAVKEEHQTPPPPEDDGLSEILVCFSFF